MDAAQKTVHNRLLAQMSAPDFALLQPQLEWVDLPVRKLLEGRGRRIEFVYFLEKGIASVVVSAGARHSLEVGIVGHEGMTGLAVLLGSDSSLAETFMQAQGAGWRMPVSGLRQSMEQSEILHSFLLRYAHTVVTQMAFTALANGSYNISERLARWLMMAHDRAGSDDVFLTHEFLSVMLGVRRPGVTAALGELEKRGIILTGRGMVTIKNRAALEETANGAYGAAEAEYARLFGAGERGPHR